MELFTLNPHHQTKNQLQFSLPQKRNLKQVSQESPDQLGNLIDYLTSNLSVP